MDTRSLRRFVPLLIAGAALIAAACSESVAPTRPQVQSNLPTLTSFGNALVSSARANDRAESKAETFTFRISQSGGMAKIGEFYLVYPARSVCDPDRSGYGPGEWDVDCPTLNRAVTIRAKFWVEDGRTHADFEPDIRFAPGKNVYLTAFVPEIRGREITDALKAQYGIFYSTRQGNTRYFIDEAVSDPSLATIFGERNGLASGRLTRRVKHFSGYYVRSGRVCDESSADCGGDTALQY